ncbi:hypothetical protein OC846_003205 [Tilletia horrida]|uniref:AMMECR1 domain-containing protein n=1 Tax=Tilletia horrida TaxID=155126 RepID=A0AAN6GV82_9BASI|nr:hypothetical protein OC845_004896 [Tilletia horrida]KAK0551609.1 hypothetical protein OC846_003205 [Tilletia horrida]KAK0565200.1 hypothetical protein OC861_003875 [Tilletia horrida]
MAPDGEAKSALANGSRAGGSKQATASVDQGGVVLPEHCYYCFDVLEAELKSSKGSYSRYASTSAAAENVTPHFENTTDDPLFVTWNIFSSHSRKPTPRLRGCIGTFSPTPLAEGLRDYALTSALHDTRFDPISTEEMLRLECGVSLLTDFEECEDHLDWEIGTHGIYIYLPNPRKSSSRATLTATYLPDVAPAQGWTKEEAIDSAIEKAGWSGPVDAAMRNSLRVRRYQSAKVSCTYEQWQTWKQSNGAKP